MPSNKTVIVAITLIFTLLLVSSPIEVSATSHDIYTERIYGDNRFETTVEIAKKGWPQSDYVVISTAYNFPDALSGAPLAYQYDAPILLTNADRLPPETRNEIHRLQAQHAIILGGENAVTNNVKNELEQMGLDVQRIFGESRSETALKIAEQLGSYQEAVLVDGNNYPDALAIAPYAARHGIPIFLTERDSITDDTRAALNEASQVYVIGGEQAISRELFQSLPGATRNSGIDRFETAARIVTTLGIDVTKSYVATGYDFVDALTGSVLAAKHNAPILLVAQGSVSVYAQSLLADVEEAYILGGEGAVSQQVINQISGQTEREEEPKDDQPLPKSAQQIYAENHSKVVLINTDSGQGSGVLVSDGLILTNEHVVRDMIQSEITLSNGDKYEIEGIVAIDAGKDLALIKTRQRINIEPVKIGDTNDVLVGEDVVAIGSPEGLQNTLSTGIISGIRQFDGVKHLQITASITFGSSGGGLFNQYGELIGITTWGVEGGGNLNFAVDIAEIQPWQQYFNMNHGNIPIEEVPDIPEPSNDSISMGMSKEQIKSYENSLSSTLFHEDTETLMYSGGMAYGLRTGIMYSFTNNKLDQMTYIFEDLEYLSVDELEGLYLYLLNELEYDYGTADYADNYWYDDGSNYVLRALWNNNNQRPSDIYMTVVLDSYDFSRSSGIMFTIR